MIFEWSQSKSHRNQLRHGLSFDLAARVFNDPNVKGLLDQRFLYGEERWMSLGLVSNTVIIVAYTVEESENEEEIIRIISARKATCKEEKHYYSYSFGKATT